jgi:hypothetical protein
MTPLGRYKTLENDWPWPMPMGILNHMCYMGYRQMKISWMKTYSMGYIRSWTSGNKGPITKMPHVSGISGGDTIPSSVTSSPGASYAWDGDTAKNNVATHINVVRLPFHVESVQTTPDSIMLAIPKASSIITLFS